MNLKHLDENYDLCEFQEYHSGHKVHLNSCFAVVTALELLELHETLLKCKHHTIFDTYLFLFFPLTATTILSLHKNTGYYFKGLFRTQSNIYDRTFLRKYNFRKKASLKIFDWVLNI